MQIEKLLEEQKKQFNQLKLNDTWYCGGNQDNVEMLNEETWNWHKQSLKQFIDGLVLEFEDKILTYEPDLSYQDPDFRITQRIYEDCLKDTISNLKEIRAKIK